MNRSEPSRHGQTPYFLIHQSRTGTAHPPVHGSVPTMAEWASRHSQRRPWWQRLFQGA